jgi:DNA-binding PadR family transcriptional regulator
MGWYRSGCSGGEEDGRRFVFGRRNWSLPGGGNIHFEMSHGPPGRRGGGGSGGRRGPLFGRIELGRVLLKLIADEPRHGYDLIRAVEDLTHGEYSPSPGVVYPALSLLEDVGRIEIQPGEGTRKKYAITQDGLDYLDRHADSVEELFERLAKTGEGTTLVARASASAPEP